MKRLGRNSHHLSGDRSLSVRDGYSKRASPSPLGDPIIALDFLDCIGYFWQSKLAFVRLLVKSLSFPANI